MPVDTTTVWVELIKQLPAIFASLISAIVALLAYLQSRSNATANIATRTIVDSTKKTADETKKTTDETASKTDKLAQSIDGMQTQLLAVTEAKGRAEGALAATNPDAPELLGNSQSAVTTKVMANIDAKVDGLIDTAKAVGEDLKASHERADAVPQDMTRAGAGESADASARSPLHKQDEDTDKKKEELPKKPQE
jgi:hypothetical protein